MNCARTHSQGKTLYHSFAQVYVCHYGVQIKAGVDCRKKINLRLKGYIQSDARLLLVQPSFHAIDNSQDDRSRFVELETALFRRAKGSCRGVRRPLVDQHRRRTSTDIVVLVIPKASSLSTGSPDVSLVQYQIELDMSESHRWTVSCSTAF